MAKLPVKTLSNKMDSIVHESFPRPHLGGSVVGHSCARYILYHFRWAYKNRIESKLNRIFRIGDAIEEILIKELEHLGIEVIHRQGQVGGYKGHGGGSTDGEFVYEGKRYLFEAKSMNHANFLEIKRKETLESKPQYYNQCQMYMGKRELDATYLFVMDKNTSEVYEEIIEFDPIAFEMLLAKEEETIDAVHVNLFPKVSQNPSWFQCKFCDAKFVCHHNLMPEKNCRTCEHVVVAPLGVWSCSQFDLSLSVDEQEAGCHAWECSEMFINEV